MNEEELKVVKNVCKVFKSMHLIPCTTYRYCIANCPNHISIPDLFACLNSKNIYHAWNADYYYNQVHTKNKGKASDCIKCGKCAEVCPRNLIPSMIINNPANSKDLEINKCIACGLCSYVCPSKIEVRDLIKKIKEANHD